jgi:hypothetical protein
MRSCIDRFFDGETATGHAASLLTLEKQTESSGTKGISTIGFEPRSNYGAIEQLSSNIETREMEDRIRRLANIRFKQIQAWNWTKKTGGRNQKKI